MAEPRTLVRRYTGETDYWPDGIDRWELCIDERGGCGIFHSHDWGHDFPMERAELIELRDQINHILSATGLQEPAQNEPSALDSEMAPGTPLGDAYDRIIEKQNRSEEP